MSPAQPTHLRRVSRSINDDSDPFLIPSWFVSVTIHGVVLFLVATNIQSCTGGGSAVGEGDYRQVGIYVKAPDTFAEKNSPDAGEANADDAKANADPAKSIDDTTVQDLIQLPEFRTPTIGPGTAPSSVGATDVGDLLKPNGIGPSSSSQVPSAGETSFFNIKDSGRRFVYVMDRSGSMSNHRAINVAKAELKSSLQSLDATQMFQVVFYNTGALEMRQPSDKRKLYAATEINRTIARQFIDTVSPDGGTNHMPALRMALRFQPEVVYFLTDADEPQLTAGELAEIKRINRGRARIHCVEFGVGERLASDNFLKRLARENGGTYRYRNVARFVK